MKRIETRTYADRREYLTKAVKIRRRKIKAKVVELMGGMCQICGYSYYQGALELHHVNPEDKGFQVGRKGYSMSWAAILAEVKKCILVCANCHREVGAGITPPLPLYGKKLE